jgi:hypothetical protein
VTVQGLAEKMQAAAKAGDANATEWLTDLKTIAEDGNAEQSQANALLQAIHAFITNIAHARGDTAVGLAQSLIGSMFRLLRATSPAC